MAKRLPAVASIAIITAAATVLQAGPVSAATAKPGPGGGQVAVPSISCPSALDCTAVGFLLPPGQNLAFLASETGGTWHKAERVPGLSALPGGNRRAVLNAVSCSSPDTCGAGGFYVDHARKTQAFVVSEKNGSWGTAEEVPGLAAHNSAVAHVNVVSCSSPGNCAVGGDYHANGSQSFVVSQRNGTWGLMQTFPAINAVNTAGLSSINALWCRSAGTAWRPVPTGP